jgi:ankyrin repeat protein|uniref:Uncharacterized protein n=1 Tax=Eutreptiella gymnastica TaxID=73025 RepID=A0A7S4CTK6_9EUGL|mmetsp:Transcript_68607/g.114620  ORF Transcript_68607/g.114620 Transcript_68607/m.114620 type:complete len:522 (-) Transcript_68607:853-2418(-)|eukprot:CAMPEP_0174302856 /NCGR_PEP_ID=MMETSP0809-20121228/59850_1 /TAXON_ID=73025 ORGANISM="Eutreptiella gymnastica-like, Strain CCMP1594" /NCGR_SAMPLE_ID=MMETSP0809 /ASSEMBLY_ACC=CAM_ASM_000658 /LENGTH=521 /DNA_ID=CAMNT_0015408793 /DNA_START=30 /DNA_END=1595 /DNA_ORIENTATION=+
MEVDAKVVAEPSDAPKEEDVEVIEEPNDEGEEPKERGDMCDDVEVVPEAEATPGIPTPDAECTASADCDEPEEEEDEGGMSPKEDEEDEDKEPLTSTEIFEAAESGDHARVRKLLNADKRHARISNDDGETALHVVVKDCYIICAQMLINEGADLDAQNKDGQTPLHLAIFHGSLDIIDLLLVSGASPMLCDHAGMNALHMSAQMGLFRVAEVLLMDMDFEQEEEEQEVCPKCWHAPTITNHEEGVENRPVCDLCAARDAQNTDQSKRLPVDKVGLLKKKDKDGNTPLHITASEPDYCSLALEFCGVLKDEVPDGAREIVSMLNNEKLTPLQCACYAGNAEVIGELLDMGCEPRDANEKDENCFHLVVQGGHFPAVWQILERRVPMGEDWVEFLNKTDGEGNNVMHIACKFGHERTVMELLRHRRVLDINALNKNEETPAVLAYKEGWDHIMKIMLANQADEGPVEAAKKDDEEKGIVREIKGDFSGTGSQQKVSYTPLIAFGVLMVFIGPYVLQFIDRFF